MAAGHSPDAQWSNDLVDEYRLLIPPRRLRQRQASLRRWDHPDALTLIDTKTTSRGGCRPASTSRQASRNTARSRSSERVTSLRTPESASPAHRQPPAYCARLSARGRRRDHRPDVGKAKKGHVISWFDIEDPDGNEMRWYPSADWRYSSDGRATTTMKKRKSGSKEGKRRRLREIEPGRVRGERSLGSEFSIKSGPPRSVSRGVSSFSFLRAALPLLHGCCRSPVT